METFQSYEQEFCKSIQQVSRNVTSIQSLTRERKEHALNELQRDLTDSEKCLRQMEIELSSLTHQDRQKLQKQMKSHKDLYEQLKKQLRKEEEIYMEWKNKDTLMGSRLDSESPDHKQRLLSSNDLVFNQGQKLEKAKQQALESEQIALDTMNDLQRQREVLDKSSFRVTTMNQSLGQSNQTIKEIQRRIQMNRMVLCALFALATIVILVFIYNKHH